MVFQRSKQKVATNEFKVFYLFSLPSFQADNTMAFFFYWLIITAATGEGDSLIFPESAII